LETYQYEGGKIKISWEMVDLNALIGSCFMDVMELADSKQITLNNQISAKFPHIPGDNHQLKRVFMNLIGNALENIPQGSEIKIQAKASDTDITLTVQDNGPGIPSEILPNLFERYYIGDQIRRKIGTGLGLYICRMIMQHHHGSIQVESNPGQGTCFYLTLLKQPMESTL
jgi:signal transduction histidine kinase